MSWRPKTLKDDTGETAQIRCPCCRVPVSADGLAEVPPAVADGHPYLCGGCRMRRVREGRVTREQIVTFQRAPAAVRAKARRLDQKANTHPRKT